MSVKNLRKIIAIDEDRCDGCGLCATACHEEAIKIVDGKAKLVSDIYCDGLGDCLGECPQGAITMEVRQALPFDPAAVEAKKKEEPSFSAPGCPGKAAMDLRKSFVPPVELSSRKEEETPACQGSRLANWPLQIALVPEEAPYLVKAPLVIAADCTAFAHPNFQRTFFKKEGSLCLIGCPKLDNAGEYQQKLGRLFNLNRTPQVQVLYMEVPCCGGLVNLVQQAASGAEHDMDVTLTRISLQGEVLEEKTFCYRQRGK